LFPLYGSGIILGGAAGGLLTQPLARTVGAENLLLVWAASMVAASLLAGSVAGSRTRRRARPLGARRRRPAGPIQEIREGARFVRGSPLLRWMSTAMVLFGLLYFSLSLPFARSVTARFPDADRLAGFLGVFAGITNAVALVVSLLLANRLFATFGVGTTVTSFPAVYVIGFATLAVNPGFVVMVGFRFLQLVWMYGVWSSGWQALWGVVPPERREQTRAFMDGGPMQAGIVLAGVLLLLAQEVLTVRQLFVAAAVLATLAVLAAARVRAVYAGAVGEALRAGWPEVFAPEEEPFGGIIRDRAALGALLVGVRDPDPGTRRIAMQIIAGRSEPEAARARVDGLADPDPTVRAVALQGLARVPEHGAVDLVLRLRDDPAAEVRAAVANALVVCARRPEEAVTGLRQLLADPEPAVRVHAAVALRRAASDAQALNVLVELARSPDPAARISAVAALGELGGEPEVVRSALGDEDAAVRRAAATALGSFPEPSVEHLLVALGDEDAAVRQAAAAALARTGPSVEGRLVGALEDDRRAEAALAALSRLPVSEPRPIRRYAVRQEGLALHYHGLWRVLPSGSDERVALLRYALRYEALRYGRRALLASAVLGDRAAVQMALENLESRDPNQRANALEMLETIRDHEIVRPLLGVWDPEPAQSGDGPGVLRALIGDDDPWLRACAALAAASLDGSGAAERLARMARDDPDPTVRETAARAVKGDAVQTLSKLSLMDRILALRMVPLFRELAPEDLKHVAEAASEHVYPDRTLIAEEGEPGDAMHVVVSGEVRVLVEGGDRVMELARRGPGYIVGEMSVLSEEPRMASLLAEGDVRTLTIDRKRFQRIVRERPDAALAVMRELCVRLREVSTHPGVEVSG
jgi:HEAT repeat protein